MKPRYYTMLIGNPDKFAFLFEPVPEWCSKCFVNGLLYIYVNGRQFPETLRTTTLSDDMFFLIDSPAFSKPRINAPLFLLEKRELFIKLCKVTFPEDGTENDYSYLLPLDELQSAGYCFFAIAFNNEIRILVGHYIDYIENNQLDFIDDVVLDLPEFDYMRNQVHDYYKNTIKQ